MKIACGACAALIDNTTPNCPICGHRHGSFRKQRAKARQFGKREGGAKYAQVMGGSAVHVTRANPARHTSGGLPSLGKRR